MKMITNIYDRLISNRLKIWASIEPEQSAYQKGKSTLHPIFILRLLIEIFKRKKKKLFILFVDLSTAFDNVNRYKLLKILKNMGCGQNMLNAIRNMYIESICSIVF